jgi:hypothetical protein
MERSMMEEKAKTFVLIQYDFVTNRAYILVLKKQIPKAELEKRLNVALGDL